ncbi:hypothetical protein GBAR_LOCUS3696 [Geodia barretti]|uniref:Uncharacterized protein n=1 Tax=Geodia barretti TaxID=519541 RepID=A0AA35R5Z7_GEOBA|nr:hypothetical protein GBAR_LOCUS3696 [Geodia barretti]
MDVKEQAREPASLDPVPYAATGLPGQGSSLVDMLHHINELDVIPQLQIADTSRTSGDISSGGLHYSDGHGHIPEVGLVLVLNVNGVSGTTTLVESDTVEFLSVLSLKKF